MTFLTFTEILLARKVVVNIFLNQIMGLQKRVTPYFFSYVLNDCRGVFCSRSLRQYNGQIAKHGLSKTQKNSFNKE